MELTRRRFIKTTALGAMGYIEKYHFPQKRKVKDLLIGDSMMYHWKREGTKIAKPGAKSSTLERMFKSSRIHQCDNLFIWTGTAESSLCNSGEIELEELLKHTTDLIDTIYKNLSYKSITILSPFNRINSENKDIVDYLNHQIKVNYNDYLDIRPLFFNMETGKVKKNKRNMFKDKLHLSEPGYKYLEKVL